VLAERSGAVKTVPIKLVADNAHLVVPHVIYVHTSPSTDWSQVVVTLLIGVVAPIITGIFVMRGTRNTISAQRKQLELSLNAEGKRLRERAAFERGEGDRTELRQILDSFAEHLGAMSNALSVAGLWAGLAQTAQQRGDTEEGEFRKHVLEQIELMHASRNAAAADRERLRLRLGEEAERMSELSTQMFRLGGESMVLNTRGLDLKSTAGLMTNANRVEELNQEFVAEARKFTEARLHTPPPEVEKPVVADH